MENVFANPQVHEHSIMRSYSFIFLFLCVLLQHNVNAQDVPMSKRAKDLYDKGQKAWQTRQLPESTKYFEEAFALAPQNFEINLRLAQSYDLQKNEALTKKHYKNVIQILPDAPQSANAYFWLGKNIFQQTHYDSAQVYFENAKKLFPNTSNAFRQSEKYLTSCIFAIDAVKAPLPVRKVAMGDTINFLNSQFFPVLTADGETLIFTGITEKNDENMYTTNRIAGGWDVPESISAAINTENNEGTCSISADGRTLVFTACNLPDGLGSCDLYISRKNGKDWSTPLNLGEIINTRNWESQPSLSADGRTLYFASDRQNGFGKKDIWVTNRDQKGQWTTPKNLGAQVNTAEDDNAPFIHANGHTLFYASNGLPGMGGYDIYSTQRIDSSWSNPVNIGYPINTISDQVGLFITSDNKTAYYTDDNRGKKQGRALLYTFEVPQSLRDQITPTRYAKGVVLDKITRQPLSATIELYDLQTQSKVGEYASDPSTGTFLAVLNAGSAYAFYVTKAGYLFKSLSFSMNDQSTSVKLDIPLEVIQKDKIEILNNIFFNTAEFALDDKSKVELHKLVLFLAQNKSVKIEISGHTDDVGSDQENLILSKKRATSVQNYLIHSGISPDRITAVGHGKNKPVVINDSDENRQKNRRIEWRIL